MKKLKYFLASVFAVSIVCLAFAADDPDPAYIKAFGNGVIIAADHGFPSFGTYDSSQFDYRKGIFYVTHSDDMQLNMRLLLPKGLNFNKCFDKLHKDKKGYMEYFTVDQSIWTIWASHDASGKQLYDSKHPWPKKLTDIPSWEPVVDVIWTISDEYRTNTSTSFSWESIDKDTDQKQTLQRALQGLKPGNRLYVVWRAAYLYNIPGGQMESKWDSDLNRFVDKPAPARYGYEYSDPYAACTIELK